MHDFQPAHRFVLLPTRALTQWWSKSQLRNSLAHPSLRTPLYPQCPHRTPPLLLVTPLPRISRTSLFPLQPTKTHCSLTIWQPKNPGPTSGTKPLACSHLRTHYTPALYSRQGPPGQTHNLCARSPLSWCLQLAQRLVLLLPVLQHPQQLLRPIWDRRYSARSNRPCHLWVQTSTNPSSHPTSCQARCSHPTVSRSTWGNPFCTMARRWMFSLSLQTWSNRCLWVQRVS